MKTYVFERTDTLTFRVPANTEDEAREILARLGFGEATHHVIGSEELVDIYKKKGTDAPTQH